MTINPRIINPFVNNLRYFLDDWGVDHSWKFLALEINGNLKNVGNREKAPLRNKKSHPASALKQDMERCMIILLVIIAILLFLILVVMEPALLELVGSCLSILFGLTVLVVGGFFLLSFFGVFESFSEGKLVDQAQMSNIEFHQYFDDSGVSENFLPEPSQMSDEELLREIKELESDGGAYLQ